MKRESPKECTITNLKSFNTIPETQSRVFPTGGMGEDPVDSTPSPNFHYHHQVNSPHHH